ncbi:PatB family C-S lyase [Rhizobium sp. RU36D]|uniref:MalY/PatB family protein n=1 Tax=Rhizobium sp. RU36D TaxID=1907415 RepID=UPI0009D79F48|nr:PatB family C-S lyase [Rhizobium sp. RU36D]SMC49713.1 cystathione beta-lyase [Rhizobium sp. RU36D]
MLDFDRIIERRDTGSSKWSRYGADVLPMWVADMDFPSAPEIFDAIRRRLDHPCLGYGVGRDELRHQIVSDMQTKYGWSIEPEDIVFLPGVEPGFNMALKAMLQPGDGVVVQTPAYRPMLNAPSHWDMKRIDAPLLATDDGYKIDLNDFDKKLGQARALLFCNPHNPTGKVFTPDELQVIAALCERNDTLIISDEIHCELLFDNRTHVPVATLSPEIANRTITLMSAAKTYNIAGLKTAFAIVQNKAMRERFMASKLGMVDSVNILGLEATLAAFRHGEAWKTAMLAYIQSNRDYLSQEVASRFPEIRLIKAESTFLAWLDCSALDLKPDPQAHFLNHGKVGFSAGAEFGAGYERFIRLNFGCPRAMLSDGLDRIELALSKRHG